MIKVTLFNIKAAEPALLKLADTNLPVKTAYKIGKLLHVLNTELQLIDKQRVKLIEQYGTKSETTKDITIEPGTDAAKKFEVDFLNFLETETTLNTEPLEMELLDEISYVNITPREISSLYVFFQDYKNGKPDSQEDNVST